MITKTFNVKAFRKLDDPFENGKSKKYVFYVKVDDVPEGIPMATNPREQRLNSNVAKAIAESLTSNDGFFHLKNRGIVISAGKVKYNNQRDEVVLEFDDNDLHGNIDGGHTYKIVCEHKGECLDQYVQFEVMTGVEEIIEDLARARNTSVQVDEKSMAELANKFAPIKAGLQNEVFYKRIAFKQNQVETDEDTGRNLKMIDAREIVAIIGMFDVDNIKEGDQPIQAYSSKKAMLDKYLADPDHFQKFKNIAPDIFKLFDTVEREFADAYNEGGGRYGRKKYSGYRDGANSVGKSKFNQCDISYKIPNGFLYPVVGGFRTLVVTNEETGLYEWRNGEKPVDVWERCKNQIAKRVMSYASDLGDSPNAVGKASNVWDMTALTVMTSK